MVFRSATLRPNAEDLDGRPSDSRALKRAPLKRGKSLAPATFEEAVERQVRAAKRKAERAAAARVPPARGRGRVPAPKKARKTPSPANRRTPPLAPGAVCVHCGDPAMHHHHVIYRQQLRWVKGDAAALANLVPACLPCHSGQHSQKDPIPLAALPDSVFEFAAELLGPGRAYGYLQRRYAGDDDRLAALLQQEES